jgi:hypothetical protein
VQQIDGQRVAEIILAALTMVITISNANANGTISDMAGEFYNRLAMNKSAKISSPSVSRKANKYSNTVMAFAGL